MHSRWRFRCGEHGLPALTVGLAVASLAYIPLAYGPAMSDVPNIVVPLGLSVVVGAFTLGLRRRGYQASQIEQIGQFGWMGLVIAAVVGGWWVVHQLHRGASVVSVSDQLLTVLSVGLGTGVFLGRYTTRQQRVRRQSGHDRVLSEGTWTDRPGPNPVLVAVIEQLAELEGSDPVDVDVPLHDYVDPDVFETLTERSDGEWQVRFYTDEYQIRVSGHGTVTVYDAHSLADEHATDAARALR